MCVHATCALMCIYVCMYRPEQHQVFSPVSFLHNCSRQVLSVNLEPTAWLKLLCSKLWEFMCLFLLGLGCNPLNFLFLKQVLGLGTAVLMLVQQALTPQPVWSLCQSLWSPLHSRSGLAPWVIGRGSVSESHQPPIFTVVWVCLFFFF